MRDLRFINIFSSNRKKILSIFKFSGKKINNFFCLFLKYTNPLFYYHSQFTWFIMSITSTEILFKQILRYWSIKLWASEIFVYDISEISNLAISTWKVSQHFKVGKHERRRVNIQFSVYILPALLPFQLALALCNVIHFDSRATNKKKGKN